MRFIKTPSMVKFIMIILLSLSWAKPQTDTVKAGSLIDSSLSKAPSQTVENCWDLLIDMHFPMPDQRGQVTIEGDSVRGFIKLHGDNLTIRDGTVNGHHIRFTTGSSGNQAIFEGNLEKFGWKGTMTKGRKQIPWKSSRCLHDK